MKLRKIKDGLVKLRIGLAATMLFLTLTLFVSPVDASAPEEGNTATAIDSPADSVSIIEEKSVSTHRALVIGIADYQSVKDLNYSDDDARGMKDGLIEIGFSSQNITTYIDSQATKNAIKNAISSVAVRSTSSDLFIFYFSGHGGTYDSDIAPIDEADGFDEYLVPYDANINISSQIRDDELKSWLSSVPGKKVVILDSCHSGGFSKSIGITAKTLTGIKEANIIDGFSKDLDISGFFTMTACKENETSIEDPDLFNGIFTEYLIEGLYGNADINGNGITAEELFYYAEPLTLNRANYYQIEQHPQVYDGIFGDTMLTSFLPPSISGLVPDTGIQGATLTAVQITGTHLAGATSLVFSGNGVTASNISIISSTQITASISITSSAATGARNVTVTTANGTSPAAGRRFHCNSTASGYNFTCSQYRSPGGNLDRGANNRYEPDRCNIIGF